MLLPHAFRYGGMPASSVLYVMQLLYLNYESASKPVYMYINTPGTSTPDGRAIGFETEAFAISDCMNYVKPPVYTIGVGQVYLYLSVCVKRYSASTRMILYRQRVA